MFQNNSQRPYRDLARFVVRMFCPYMDGGPRNREVPIEDVLETRQ